MKQGKKFPSVGVSPLFIALFVLLAAGIQGCGMQSIPTSQNEVEASWSEVLNQYKRRADLIPNLVATVKGYASHEKETLESVVSARAKATQTQVTLNDPQSVKNFSQAQASLSSALSRLMVVAERYPDLKANENFRDLQAQLEGTENRVTIARRRYIESVNRFNNLITVPPTSWYNSMFLKLSKKPQLGFEGEEQVIKDAPKVDFK